MYCGKAYWHQFDGEPCAHLWFVLSEPGEYVYAVCLSLTSRNKLGEQILQIPAQTQLTLGSKTQGPFITENDSTVHIQGIVPIRLSNAKAAFKDSNCHGEIVDKWIWQLRKAVRDGYKFVRGDARRDIRFAIDSWFDQDGNPVLDYSG